MPEELRIKLRARISQGWPQCKTCRMPLLFARLEALPDTDVCASHSKEGGYVGVPIFGHKTAPEVGKVKADPTADDGLGESVRQLLRGYHRGR